jgi:hypothetical protein
MMVVPVGSTWRDQHLSGKKDSMIILKVLLQAPTKGKLHLVHVRDAAACHTEQSLRLKNIWLIESEVEKHLVDRGFAESFITAEHNNVEG